MRLDSTPLPYAKITQRTPTKKTTVFEYLWCDQNLVEESGAGILTITVAGRVTTAQERDAVEQITAADGIKRLYHPSEIGMSDDRYYLVQTEPADVQMRTASSGTYTIRCLAADPTPYDSETEEAVY